MNQNLVGSIYMYGRFCIKLPQSRMKGERHRLRVSEEEILKNWPIRKKNCLWRPCLVTDRDEMSIIYRGPSIDASYQVSVHLAERFQRRRLFFFDL
jgi:hypothetical protein